MFYENNTESHLLLCIAYRHHISQKYHGSINSIIAFDDYSLPDWKNVFFSSPDK